MAQVNDIRSLIKLALNEYYKKYQIKMSDAPAPTDKNPAIKIIEDGGIYIVGVGNYTGGTLANKKTLQLVLASTSKINDEAGPTSTTETYSAAKITELVGNVAFNVQIVSTLPSTGDEHTIYLVLSESAETQDIYDEWLYVHSGELYVWEKIGSTAANLDNYYTKDLINASFYVKDHIDASFYTKDYINASFYDKDHIDASFYVKDHIDASFYTKDYIDTSFYDKAWIDSSFSNIPLSQLKAGQNVSISVNGSINAIGYVYNENSSSFSAGRSLAIGKDAFAEGYCDVREYSINSATVNRDVLVFLTDDLNVQILKGEIVKLNSEYYIAITNAGFLQNRYRYSVTLNRRITDFGELQSIYVYSGGAYGNYSHAEGYNTMAEGEYSHAAGYKTIANLPYMTAVGAYNSSISNTNEMFAVGVGLDDTHRATGFSVKKGSSNAEVDINGQLIVHTGNLIVTDSQNNENSLSIINGDNNSARANVNGISDVYLGCPIGTIVMWSDVTAPEGWLLCNGSVIGITNRNSQDASLYLPNLKTLCETLHYDFYYDHNLRICKLDGQTFQYANSVSVTDESVTVSSWTDNIADALIFVESTQVSGEGVLGKVICVPNLQQRFPLGALDGGTIGKNGHDSNSQGWATELGDTGGESTNTLDVKEMPSHKHDLYVDNDGTTLTTRYTINTIEESKYSKASDWDGSSGTQGSIPDIMFASGSGNAHNNIPPFIALNFIIKYQ